MYIICVVGTTILAITEGICFAFIYMYSADLRGIKSDIPGAKVVHANGTNSQESGTVNTIDTMLDMFR